MEPYAVVCRHGLDEAIHRRRIQETCERMLAAQKPDGWFPCYCSANGASDAKLGDGGAFTNGSVGEALVLAAGVTGESRYLEASRRAADYAWYRWEDNQNYAAFALWHLAALYEVDGKKAWLDKALYYSKHFVTRDIGLCGAADAHNYYTGYGNITLKGMARLLEVLPKAHAYRPVLREQVIRFTNQILSRQQPDGWFAGRNRKYLGYRHAAPGLFAVAAAVPEFRKELEPALAAMYHAVAERILTKPEESGSPDDGLTVALMGRYVAG